MTSERDPILNPQPGDILQRPDGTYVLVDYVDALNAGFMCTNQITGSYYLEGWAKWMDGSTVVERGSLESCPWNQPTPHIPSRWESTDYLQRRLGEISANDF